MMFKIGDFSKVCQVSIKTLRYWDDVELLKPEWIDPENNYRYYTITQLYEVNRILALKIMGLSIKQIKAMLNDDPSPDEIRGMFMLKRAELEQEVEEAQQRLIYLESRLKHIDESGMLQNHDVILKEIAPQPVLSYREKYVDTNQLAHVLIDMHNALKSYMTDKGWAHIAVFHDPAYLRDDLDVEVGFTVTSDESNTSVVLPDQRFLTVQTLSGVDLMATTIHRGSWMTLAEGYSALGRWIHDNGYEMVSPGREIFHSIGKDVPDETYITELQMPIRKISA